MAQQESDFPIDFFVVQHAEHIETPFTKGLVRR